MRAAVQKGVQMRPKFWLTSVACLAVSVTAAHGGAAGPAQQAIFDTENWQSFGSQSGPPRDCSATPPAAWSVAGTTDDGHDVAIEVAVLLDGVTKARAQELLAAAGSAYAELNMTLVPSVYKRVRLVADQPATGRDRPKIDAGNALAQAEAVLGGRRPAGSDVVHVLTNKDITLPAYGTTPMGAAECAGGVQYDDMAFAISEDLGSDTYSVDRVGLTAVKDAPAETVAHEIGHLLGALHAYKSCVEGAGLDDVLNRDPSPCTVMSDVIDLASLRFGAAEAAVIRGYGLRFADS